MYDSRTLYCWIPYLLVRISVIIVLSHSRPRAFLRRTILLSWLGRHNPSSYLNYGLKGFLCPSLLKFRRLSLVDCICSHLGPHLSPSRGDDHLSASTNRTRQGRKTVVCCNIFTVSPTVSVISSGLRHQRGLLYAHQWPNIQSLLYLYILPAHELKTWTLPSLKHPYAVMLSCEDLKPYRPHFYHGPKLVAMNVNGTSGISSGIAWGYLESLITLELDFYHLRSHAAQVRRIRDSDRRLSTT